jgi:hypothetical protein
MSWTSGRARVSRTKPEAKGTCDRCGFLYSLNDLPFQFEWAGPRLQNLQLRVCMRCYDTPQEQLRTIILPPDPVPVLNPRIEYYGIEVTSFLQSEEGPSLLTEAGSALIYEINVTPDPDPGSGGVLIP